MNKISKKLRKYFSNGYGADELYRFLLVICLIILIINLFVNSIILEVIELIIFTFAMYRAFSQKHERRRKENELYMKIKDKLKKGIAFQKQKRRDHHTHMYKKCPKCKQKLRLPLRKGTHMVKCPTCGNKFEVKCRRDEKIKVEIVK